MKKPKGNMFERYHRMRADILMENCFRSFWVLLVVGMLFMMIHLVDSGNFFFGLSQGFIISAVIIMVMNLLFYFPKTGRFLRFMGEELK